MENSAVEWLVEQLNKYGDMAFNKQITIGEYHIKKQEVIEQAKEMENSQRQKDFKAGNDSACMEHEDIEDYFKQYIKSE